MTGGAARALPPTLAANPRLSSWVSFASDGTVAVRTGKVELGQGILTALAQIVAEELDVRIERVRVAAAGTATAPDEGLTSGSLSVQHSGGALRQVCAEIRSLCLAAAAVVLAAAPDEISLADGEFRAGVRSVDYWQLPTVELLDRDADGRASAKPRADYGVVGTSVPRVDLEPKVIGAARYLTDLRLDGQLYARVVRPPARDATLIEVAPARAAALDGVLEVVVAGDYLAVLASREETAVAAAALLAADARWRRAASLPDEDRLLEFLLGATAETTTVRDTRTTSAPAPEGPRHTATFTRPYLAHASIGTSSATGLWAGDVLRVWTHSQGIFALRAELARALELPTDAVVVQHVEAAGCYGHNGADDAAYDAAVLALRVPGRPVQVTWSRQDELGWAPLGPAMAVQLTAELGPDGAVRYWQHEVWSNGHTSRPGSLGPQGLAGYLLHNRAGAPPVALDPPLARGAGSARNAVPGYDFAEQLVVAHRLTTMPIRTSAMRALGAHLNVFAIESFVDELAALAGRDPLEFRLAHLGDPRGRRVLQAAAQRAGWGDPPAGADHGRGIGYARYKGTGAYCAVIADVEADTALTVRRLTIAVDVGVVVNPDGVANQIEGGAIQSLSWTVRERVRFDRHAIISDSWESYPILRFSEIPAVDVHVLPSDGDQSWGAGEAAAGPTAAAIGNALAAAVGVRVRDMPLTTEAIVAALSR